VVSPVERYTRMSPTFSSLFLFVVIVFICIYSTPVY
jgi:hypothetical protein